MILKRYIQSEQWGTCSDMNKEHKKEKSKKAFTKRRLAEGIGIDDYSIETKDEFKHIYKGKPAFLRIRYGLSKLLSNLRFSLTLRIALHYGAQLLRTSFWMLAVVTAAFVLAHIPIYNSTLDSLAQNSPLDGKSYSVQQLGGLSVSKAYIITEPIPDDWKGAIEKLKLTFSKVQQRQNPQLLLYADTAYGPLVAEFPIQQAQTMYIVMFWVLICCDLYRVGYFLRKRNRLNQQVLKPISNMADAAAALSANNLSDRISIDGTKNELKDLATVINHMLDRIERSYNSQKQFVSDASHELRTPIAVIQGYASMLERWGKTDKEVLDEGIAAIYQETTAMKELVERLLFLARHDKKTLMLEVEVFDPTEVMSSVYRDAQLLSPAHIFELQIGEHVNINGDKGMLKQLMRILVDNAIKYTPSGGKISLCTKKDGEKCILSVTDTGTGISAKELPRIFDRFYRSDKARQSQSSGHGLGLSIAHIIVAAHYGKLKVRSKESVGTTFSVVLPMSDVKRG